MRQMGFAQASGGSSGLRTGWPHKLRFLQGTQVSQPFQIHQAVRLVHYQEVSGLLFLLHRPDHLHRHRLRLQREPRRSSRSIMHQRVQSSSITTPTSCPISPTSSVRCSCSWRSSSSPRSWLAILKSSPSWRQVFPSSDSFDHT